MSNNKMTPHARADKASADELDADADDLAAAECLRRAQAEAEILRLRAKAKRLRAQAAAPSREEPTTMLTKREIARRLKISEATFTRLDPPGLVVGHERSKRYDLAQVRAWLEEREPKATTPREPRGSATTKASKNDGGELDATALEGAGLRVVGDGR